MYIQHAVVVTSYTNQLKTMKKKNETGKQIYFVVAIELLRSSKLKNETRKKNERQQQIQNEIPAHLLHMWIVDVECSHVVIA